MVSTVDLRVLTSLYQLIFKLKILLTFFTKQANLIRRSTVLRLPPHLVFPGHTLSEQKVEHLCHLANTA